MGLLGIPPSITPELLYALARMGHGDELVIADANFPSDAVAQSCIVRQPIRIHGKTSDILKDILTLVPLDTYQRCPVSVMDRVASDREKGLTVPAYDQIASVAGMSVNSLEYVERFEFYERAKHSFVVIQSDDNMQYANIILSKGVVIN